MIRRKRLFAWGLIAALLLSILAACSSGGGSGGGTQTPSSGSSTGGSSSSGGSSGGPGGAAPARDMKISASMFDRGQVASEEGTYEENRWTKFVNEESGVTVNWIPVLRSEAQPKLNALIATGEAPDLIWEYDRNYISALKDQGVIQPIGDYIEQFSNEYKAYLKEHPELLPYVTFDGQIYAFTSKRGIDKVANHAMWIRQDWLDKLGLGTPNTLEEFLDVLRAFRDRDPDGNGQNDTVGLAFNYNYGGVIEALFATHGGTWYLEDGQMTPGNLTDRYADALDLFKLLFEEGLIDKEYITDQNYQRERQLFVTGKAGVYIANWNIPLEYRELKENVPASELVPLEPVATKYGKFGLYQEPPANRLVAFNKDMKDPEAGVKYLDWLIGGGWFPLVNGVEGTHHRLIDGVPQQTDAELFKKEVLYAAEYAVIDRYDPQPEHFPIMAAQDPISQEYAQKQTLSLDTALKNEYRRDVPYNPSFPELSEINTSFRTFVEQTRTKVITGGGEFTGAWGLEELRKEWKRLGGDKVNTLAQEWYEKNLK